MVAWARRHRISPLLLAGGEAIDDPAWRRQVYGLTLQADKLMEEAVRLHGQLEPGLAFVVLLKGPGLGLQAWPDAAWRCADDLDFRFAYADFPIVFSRLTAAGYKPAVANAFHRLHLWHYGWGVTFLHPDGFMVEANHRLFPAHYPCPPQFDPVTLLESVTLRVDSGAIRLPSPAAHLLYVCMHALWHGGERLAWIVDIAGLLARHPGIVEQARELSGTNPFANKAIATGCRIAEIIFGPGLAHDDGQSPPRGQPSGSKAPASRGGQADVDGVVLSYLDLLRLDRPPLPAESQRLHRRLRSTRQRIVDTLRRAFIPGDGDFRRIALPPRGRNLYWLYRPIRILSKGILWLTVRACLGHRGILQANNQ